MRDYTKEISEITTDAEKELKSLIDECIERGHLKEHKIQGGAYYTFEPVGIVMTNVGGEHIDFEFFEVGSYQPEGTYKSGASEYEIPLGGMITGEYIGAEVEMELLTLNLLQMLPLIDHFREYLITS